MKSIYNIIKLANAVIIAFALSACSDTPENLPANHSERMVAASSPVIASSASTSFDTKATESQQTQGMAGFVQVWSSAETSLQKPAIAQSIGDAASTMAIEQSPEFKQLRIAINALDFERARKNASTPALKAAVEHAYQTHLEMLNTERLTAQADQEKGTKEP